MEDEQLNDLQPEEEQPPESLVKDRPRFVMATAEIGRGGGVTGRYPLWRDKATAKTLSAAKEMADKLAKSGQPHAVLDLSWGVEVVYRAGESPLPIVAEPTTTPTPKTVGRHDCPYCGKTCNSSSGLTLHIKNKHHEQTTEPPV